MLFLIAPSATLNGKCIIYHKLARCSMQCEQTMEATLNVMLLTLTKAVFCDNDMYVVTLTRSMVLE